MEDIYDEISVHLNKVRLYDFKMLHFLVSPSMAIRQLMSARYVFSLSIYFSFLLIFRIIQPVHCYDCIISESSRKFHSLQPEIIGLDLVKF